MSKMIFSYRETSYLPINNNALILHMYFLVALVRAQQEGGEDSEHTFQSTKCKKEHAIQCNTATIKKIIN